MRDLVQAGPVAAIEAEARMRALGFVGVTVQRAKRAVGVRSTEVDGHWYWTR